MGKGYSADLRERVYGEIENGQSRRAAARRFGVSVSTSIRLAQRMAAKGSLSRAVRLAAANWRRMPMH